MNSRNKDGDLNETPIEPITGPNQDFAHFLPQVIDRGDIGKGQRAISIRDLISTTASELEIPDIFPEDNKDCIMSTDEVYDELLEMEVNRVIPDNIQTKGIQKARQLLSSFQGAYRKQTSTILNLEQQALQLKTELQNSETSAQKVQAHLNSMSHQISERERKLLDLAHELGSEKVKRQEKRAEDREEFIRRSSVPFDLRGVRSHDSKPRHASLPALFESPDGEAAAMMEKLRSTSEPNINSHAHFFGRMFGRFSSVSGPVVPSKKKSVAELLVDFTILKQCVVSLEDNLDAYVELNTVDLL